MSLQNVQITDLADSRAIKLNEGESVLIEDQLIDDKNENSCSTVYYEVGC